MATKPAKPAEKTWHWGLTRTQWFGMLFVGCFLTFHSMFPFREKVMYPGNPSWHEEGHFGERPAVVSAQGRLPAVGYGSLPQQTRANACG